jgi:hypothetical protein
MNIHTLKANSISLKRFYSLSEQTFASGRHSGYVVLLPFDWCVDVFKDLFDGIGNFLPYTIARDEGHSIYTSILGWGLFGRIVERLKFDWTSGLTLFVTRGNPAARVVADLWRCTKFVRVKDFAADPNTLWIIFGCRSRDGSGQQEYNIPAGVPSYRFT